MGSEGIVFHSPSFDDYLGLPEGVKDLSIKHFFSEFTVESFTVADFPRAARFDVQGSHSCSFKPLLMHVSQRCYWMRTGLKRTDVIIT